VRFRGGLTSAIPVSRAIVQTPEGRNNAPAPDRMFAPMAGTTETTTAAPMLCPTCGAKRTRPDSTLCAYCATPFDLAAGAARKESAGGPDPTQARLARMKDQPGFDEANAWVPLESPEYQALSDRKRRGVGTLVAAGLFAGAAALWFPAWTLALAGLLAAVGLFLVATAARGQAGILARPLLKRPALVTDRRSETALGYWNGQTTYYFALSFADGSEGEFRWPGRGVDHQPLVTGATGLAFTRGDVLLGFRAIRV